jgi:hypothetical protein
MKKMNHSKYFLHAVRTALLFLAGFLIYEILLRLERMWNKLHPQNQIYHFYQRKTIKFIAILLIDLLILYGFFLFFGIEL